MTRLPIKRIKINWWTVLIGVLFSTANCLAVVVTNYVVPPGTAGVTPTDPYTNWAMAGTSIIEVVNAATNYDWPRTVLVTNGNYNLTDRIYSAKTMTIRSVNGREVTSLNGQSTGPTGLYTNMCLYNVGSAGFSTFDGFTVSNYYIRKNEGVHGLVAGVASVLNCTFVGNTNWPTTTFGGGGAVYFSYGGGGTATNCIFRDNYGRIYGGAIFGQGISVPLTVSGCIFENNTSYEYGGGIMVQLSAGGSAVISNCVFRGNCGAVRVDRGGGGIYATGVTQDIIIANCTIISNTTSHANGYGGGVGGRGFTLRNCLVAQNSGASNGAGVSITSNVFIESCTIASNSAGFLGGGVYLSGVNVTGINNIIYYNTAQDGANFTNLTGNAGLENSCVIPAVDGLRNITNDPMLLDLAGGNYHLKANSPCVNAGANQIWMTNSYDLDGRTRIRYGTVDMGAYETIYNGTIFLIP